MTALAVVRTISIGSDVLSSTELSPPAFDDPGVCYRDAMSVLDRVLPDGSTLSLMSAEPARQPSITYRYGARAGSRSHSAWATALVPASGWRSAVRRPRRRAGASW